MAETGQGGAGAQGRVVGRYEILREIGRGGMAVVYVARQPDLDRQVALKELGAFHAGSAEFAHRFLRESRLAGSLNHPNIVTVHEYFEHAETPYIAMEYVPRGSLRPYMKLLSLAQIAGVLEGVLAGLTHAESAGIVHRDLKPENIMVTADGRVKITDFGIARATERAGTQYMTATGMTVGTPTYMAPEQAMAGDIGPWTDLYSIGVLTYELVVGHVPFHDTDAPVVILMRHVNEQIPPAIGVRPEVDPGLSRWIDSLLVKDPLDRVRHAATAWESLEDIIVGLLGPLWRRNARLLDDQIAAQGSQPLTPAPFESRPMRTPARQVTTVPEAFVTFGEQAGPQTPAAPPTPTQETIASVATPEAAAAAQAPAEAAAEAAPAAAPDEAPASAPPAAAAAQAPAEAAASPAEALESGFVTFGAAAAAMSGASAAAPPAPTTEDEAPTEPAPPEAAPALAEPEPGEPEPVEPQREFVTYGGEAPPRRPAPVAPPEPEPESEPQPEPLAEAEGAPAAEADPMETEAVSAVEPQPEPEPEPHTETAPGVAVPVAAEEAPAAASRRTRRAPIGILAGGLAVAAAAIGFLVAPTSKSGPSRPEPLTQRATAGPLAISYPAGWRRSAGTPSEAAPLELDNAVTLNPGTSATGGALVLGTAANDGPALLPAGFMAALASPPAGGTVKLGSNRFVRYLDLSPQGAATPESIYAVPTTAGTATVVCVEPQANPEAFAATCERAIATLKTAGSQLPLGANPAYARQLSTVVSTLNSATAAAAGQLGHARTRRGQSAAALALSRANSRAAAQAAKLKPGPSASAANAAIVAALQKLATAYRSLGAAAARDDTAGYAAAQVALGSAQSALQAAFAQLRQGGYSGG